MGVSHVEEKKAVIVDHRAAQRFAMALRLKVEGDEGSTHDMSATGLCFQSTRSYALGAVLELVLEFPDARRVHPLRCEAEVVRCEAVGDDFNIAVRLLTPLFP